MANEILNSIVEMTGQRDLDSLEYSLTATLAELVPAQRVSLNKFLSDDDHDQIEEIVHLIINQVSKKETRYDWNHESRIFTADDHIKQCLDTLKPVRYKEKGLTCLIVPILSGSKNIGVLSIESTQELADFETLIQSYQDLWQLFIYSK